MEKSAAKCGKMQLMKVSLSGVPEKSLIVGVDFGRFRGSCPGYATQLPRPALGVPVSNAQWGELCGEGAGGGAYQGGGVSK